MNNEIRTISFEYLLNWSNLQPASTLKLAFIYVTPPRRTTYIAWPIKVGRRIRYLAHSPFPRVDEDANDRLLDPKRPNWCNVLKTRKTISLVVNKFGGRWVMRNRRGEIKLANEISNRCPALARCFGAINVIGASNHDDQSCSINALFILNLLVSRGCERQWILLARREARYIRSCCRRNVPVNTKVETMTFEIPTWFTVDLLTYCIPYADSLWIYWWYSSWRPLFRYHVRL